MSADSTSEITGAVNWAEAQLGSTKWDLLCLTFVHDAYMNGGSVDIGGADDPISYWNGHSGHNSDTNAPEGALVFWGANQYNSDGHVALSLGGGTVISSEERSYTGVHEFTIAARNNAGYASSYLGWLMPPGVSAPSGGSSTGSLLWKLRNSNTAGQGDIAFNYGANTDTPIVGDWDGNGTFTVGIVRPDPSTGSLLWELHNSNSSGSADVVFHYGANTDTPVVGDWDGNGTFTPGIVRPDASTGSLLWKLRNSNTSGNGDIVLHYGANTDKPVVGDWDGNGTTTVGIVRPDSSTGSLLWKLRNSNTDGNGDIVFHYGANSDRPITGDWDGNGTVTAGIARPDSVTASTLWKLRNSNTDGNGDIVFYYGSNTDLSVVGDWNGNGTTTIGIARR